MNRDFKQWWEKKSCISQTDIQWFKIVKTVCITVDWLELMVSLADCAHKILPTSGGVWQCGRGGHIYTGSHNPQSQINQSIMHKKFSVKLLDVLLTTNGYMVRKQGAPCQRDITTIGKLRSEKCKILCNINPDILVTMGIKQIQWPLLFFVKIHNPT